MCTSIRAWQNIYDTSETLPQGNVRELIPLPFTRVRRGPSDIYLTDIMLPDTQLRKTMRTTALDWRLHFSRM